MPSQGQHADGVDGATGMMLAGFLDARGLADNGQVPVYMHAEGPPDGRHQLRSIAWRQLGGAAQGVAVAAFNVPASHHRLTPSVQAEVFLILEHARRDPSVRVLVWTATGRKAFCGGGFLGGHAETHVNKDVLDAYRARGLAPGEDAVMAVQTKAFWDFPKPVVVAVNGLAVGAGCGFALANYGDVIFCSTRARFMYPFAALGFTPELASTLMLPWLVGMSKAKEFLLNGEWFFAAEAKRLNLVSDVFEPEELLPKAVQFASRLAGKHPTALALSKRIVNEPLRRILDETLEREHQAMVEVTRSTGAFERHSKL